MQNRLKRTTIGGYSYLTFTLDGGMVPWDPQVVKKIRSLALTPDDGDKLIEHLKKTTLAISLGMHDDYLLLAIGPSTDVLGQLGKGELAAVAAGTGVGGQVRRQTDLLGRLRQQDIDAALRPEQGRHR